MRRSGVKVLEEVNVWAGRKNGPILDLQKTIEETDPNYITI